MGSFFKQFKLKESLKFLVGGGCAVFVDFITYYCLLYLGVELSIAKTVSYIAGAFAGFVINKIWTFESKSFKIDEVWKYVALYVFSALVNIFVNRMALFVVPIKFVAFLVATGTSTVINFLGQKFVVFRRTP